MTQDIANPTTDPLKLFQENVAGQIREKIADLIPDEVLKQMVEKVLKEDVLKVHIEHDRYGSIKQVTPSPVIVMVQKQLESKIEQMVAEYFEFNKHEIEMLVKQVFEQNVGEIMVKALSNQFNQDFMNFRTIINQRFQQEGKPTIW